MRELSLPLEPHLLDAAGRDFERHDLAGAVAHQVGELGDL